MKINNIIISDEFIKLNTQPLMINKRNDNGFKFYKMNNDSILLKETFDYNREKENELMDFLKENQKLIHQTDFPIGKLIRDNKYTGQILKYYENSISIKETCHNQKLIELRNIYNHHEEDIKNILEMFNKCLDIIEEMYENGIYYIDVHSGNYLIYNNDIKLIDFESKYIRNKNKDEQLEFILNNFEYFVNDTLANYNIKVGYSLIFSDLGFEYARFELFKLENYIRMQYEKNKLNDKKR